MPLAETAGALEELVREGKIRHVGVSNFDVDQMSEFARTRPVETVQPPYHLFRRDIEESVAAADVQLSADELARIDRIMASAVPVVGPSPDAMPTP